jgi:hypothetical protein
VLLQDNQDRVLIANKKQEKTLTEAFLPNIKPLKPPGFSLQFRQIKKDLIVRNNLQKQIRPNLENGVSASKLSQYQSLNNNKEKSDSMFQQI